MSLNTLSYKAARVTQVWRDPGEFLLGIREGTAIETPGRGIVLFAQGDTANALFYILKGNVKVTVVSNAGKEAVIAILGAGDFFGEGCLAGQPSRMATTTTMAECSILRIESATAVGLLQREPAFSNLLLAYMLRRTIRIEEDLIDQLFNSSEKRLARALLLLADFGKEATQKTVIPRISQETLADMIGTTRSRVSFFMNKFRRLGFIEYNGTTIEYNGTIEVHSALLRIVLRDRG
jgi:CRP/FNR family cyclic AMP-dependent transcriptional regulator